NSPDLVEHDNITQSQVAKFSVPLQCVLQAIHHYRARLADGRLSERERGEALLFLTHFVEDLHQPMHAGLREDRGGNDVAVTFFGEETNLHALWDTQLPERFINDWQVYAAQQPANITGSEQADWVASTPIEWLAESHGFAHNNAYVLRRELGQEYLEANRPVVEQRLRQGGVRLAAVIERALSKAD
ncbi:S1/P1 nuclease, partial [Microbulbifer celer]